MKQKTSLVSVVVIACMLLALFSCKKKCYDCTSISGVDSSGTIIRYDTNYTSVCGEKKLEELTKGTILWNCDPQ